MHQYRRIGEWLLEHGILSADQLKSAIQAQKGGKMRFGELLVELGFCKESDVVRCLSEQFDLSIAKLQSVNPEKRALNVISGSYALNHCVLPIRNDGVALECVIADPLDIEVTDAIREKVGLPLRLYIAAPTALRKAIRAAYRLPTYEKPKKNSGSRMKIDAQADRQALINAVESNRKIS